MDKVHENTLLGLAQAVCLEKGITGLEDCKSSGEFLYEIGIVIGMLQMKKALKLIKESGCDTAGKLADEGILEVVAVEALKDMC